MRCWRRPTWERGPAAACCASDLQARSRWTAWTPPGHRGASRTGCQQKKHKLVMLPFSETFTSGFHFDRFSLKFPLYWLMATPHTNGFQCQTYEVNFNMGWPGCYSYYVVDSTCFLLSRQFFLKTYTFNFCWNETAWMILRTQGQGDGARQSARAPAVPQPKAFLDIRSRHDEPGPRRKPPATNARDK